MSMGIGKRYFVELKKYHYGNLDSCIEFMKSNPPSSKYEFYELRPSVKIEKDDSVTCVQYQCALVTNNKSGESISQGSLTILKFIIP